MSISSFLSFFILVLAKGTVVSVLLQKRFSSLWAQYSNVNVWFIIAVQPRITALTKKHQKQQPPKNKQNTPNSQILSNIGRPVIWTAIPHIKMGGIASTRPQGCLAMSALSH